MATDLAGTSGLDAVAQPATDDPLPTPEAQAERALARRLLEGTRRRDAARQARLTSWLAVLAVLAGMLVGFTTAESAFPSDVFGRLVSGDVEVLTGARWMPLDGDEVPFNAELRVGPLQDAVIEVRDGNITLAAGTLASTLPGTVQVEIGAVLFEVESFWLGLSPVLISRGEGEWRLDAEVNPRVAVYTGSASAASTGVPGGERAEARTMTRYEEVRVAAGAVTDVAPLVYTEADPWDVRVLGNLFAIDDAVERIRAGVERTYGTASRDQEFYEAFSAVDDGIELALERFDTDVEDGFGPPADVLVAVLVTRLISDRAVVPFPVAIDEVDELRALGATWGVVLARRDLTAANFTAAVDLSLRQIADLGDEAPPPAPPTPVPTPSPTPSPSPSPSPSPTPSPTDVPTDVPTEEPTPEPPPTEVPEECDGSAGGAPSCVTEVVDNLLEIVDDLLPPVPQIFRSDVLRSTGRRIVQVLSLATLPS